MIDTVKQFFASLHLLPPWLRQAFGVMFFGTMIVLAFTFKRWLENRRTTKDVDWWACVPVTPALVAACCWGLWASASVYHVYLDDVKTAQAKEAGKAAAAPGTATSAKSALRPAAKLAVRQAIPEPDAARAPRPEVGGAVVSGRRDPERRFPRSGRGARDAAPDAPAAIEAAPAQVAGATIAADSTAPVAPVVAPRPEADEAPDAGAPAGTPGKLGARLKSRRSRTAPAQQAAAPAPEAAPAEAPAAAQPPAEAPKPADDGPRFKVERPSDPVASPAAP